MVSISSLTETAQLIAEPARAVMLVAMLDGRSFTAGELARAAGITPQTASGHLARMLTAGLITLRQQGRHRYYGIASAATGSMLETMMSVASGISETNAHPRTRIFTGPRDEALRKARICYDHLAGQVAVGMTASMAERGQIVIGDEGAVVTRTGLELLVSLDIEIEPEADRTGSSPASPTFCRPCLDWSERRPHLAGTVGRGLYRSFLARGWIRRQPEGRAVTITRGGSAALERHFGIQM